jgi:hypothetical protein
MNSASKRFKSKIDRLQILAAASVWTWTNLVHDVRRPSSFCSSLAVQVVHLVKLRGVLIRQYAGHGGGSLFSIIPPAAIT